MSQPNNKTGNLFKITWPLLLCLLVNGGYRWLTIPPLADRGPYSMILSPSATQKISEVLTNNPWAVLLPMEIDTDRWAWATTTIMPIYWLSDVFSPATVYIIVTSICVIALYASAYVVSRSTQFATSLGLIAGLSTFLSYSFVYGNVMMGFLQIAWMAIAIACLVRYLRAENKVGIRFAAFILAMLPVIFGVEIWVNFAVPALISGLFIIFWAHRHSDTTLMRRTGIVVSFIVLALAVYMPIRLAISQSLLSPGFESESVVTYSSFLLMFEDVVINYFTYMHMTLASVLPGFLTFSPSFVALGAETIVAEQNGYHADYTHLVEASHMSSWRFVGGAMTMGFFLLGWRWIKTAWSSPERRNLVIVALFITVVTGFATYLPIKMRPFHLTAMLDYKTMVACSGLMVLIAWLIHTAEGWAPKRWKKLIVAGFAATIVLSAFTRPAAEIAGLHAVGLDGAGDPLARFTHKDEGPVHANENP